MNPLNPKLYRLLKERFGHVRVSNEGVEQVGTYGFNVVEGRDELNLIEPGEYYQVCCPFCNDTKFRLYVNHMWGFMDHGSRNLWMAICYNENCLNTIERRARFYEMVLDTMGGLDGCEIRKGKEAETSEVNMDWPGPVTRVDRLPADHKAVQYLISRRFDPAVIGKFYNVHYCLSSFRWLAQDRLIIPIYSRKRLAGWQARYIGEINWKSDNAQPKYYTCPGTPRRKLLYNLGNAENYHTGVIVEGPTDVWSFGPMAVCTLGSTMTRQQKEAFLKRFKDRSAVLLYDPDVFKDPKKLPSIEELISNLKNSFRKGFAVVKLPDGTDPGTLDRQFLREFVAGEAKAQGVEVSWRKVT